MTDPRPPAEPAAEPQREPIFNISPIVLAAMALCAIVHIVRVYVLTADQDIDLLVRTAFIPIRYSGQLPLDIYAFTSTITYAFLHLGWDHLVVNMVFLAAFGSPLANRLGALRFAVFWVSTGLGSVAIFYLMHRFDQAPVVGASGAISGMMGAAARFGFRINRSSGRPAFAGAPMPIGKVLRSRTVLTFLGVWMIVNLVTGLVGLAPGEPIQIAWEAHLGGFLTGFLATWLLGPEVSTHGRCA